MRSDVYVTVRRHRPLRPVEVLNPVMMAYWVMRFTLWVLAVGMVIMVISMVALVVITWKLACEGLAWLVAKIEDKPPPPPPVTVAWTEPEWTHAEVLDRLPSHIAADFREDTESDRAVVPVWTLINADGKPVDLQTWGEATTYRLSALAANAKEAG